MLPLISIRFQSKVKLQKKTERKIWIGTPAHSGKAVINADDNHFIFRFSGKRKKNNMESGITPNEQSVFQLFSIEIFHDLAPIPKRKTTTNTLRF